MALTSTTENLNRSSQNRFGRHPEGELTARIEQQTSKVPSVGYLGLAVGSMIASALLAIFANRKEFANFVGLWAPSFLLIGIYNKLVKLEGSESSHYGVSSGSFGTSGTMSNPVTGRR